MKLSNSILVLCENEEYASEYSLSLAKQILNLSAEIDPNDILNNADLKIFENALDDKFLTEKAESLIEDSNLRPHLAENKVFIIKRAESLTKVVQNKLLKTVEDGNINSYVIFIAKTEEGILPTILSRVQKIKLNKQTSLFQKLNDKHFKQNYEYVIDVLENMKESGDVIKFSRRRNLKKDELVEVLKVFEIIFNELLHGENQELISLNSKFKIKLIGLCLKSLDKAMLKAYSNCNSNIVLDTLFMDILENRYICG